MILRNCIWTAALVLLTTVLACSASAADFEKAGWQGRDPNTADTVRFVIISDRTGGHIYGEWEKAVAEINRLQPDFVISIGDIIEGYTGADPEKALLDQWQEIESIIAGFDAPFFYCAGNHDVLGSSPEKPELGREIYLSRHGVDGKSYYSFDYKKAHFIVLDSTSFGRDGAGEQFEWLKQDIAAAQDARHLFVFYHHPQSGANWNTLASILPKDKTTIFNGHYHAMSFRPADGIAVYVLSSTAASISYENPAAQHLFAYVSFKDKPVISFVPTGSIKTDAYPKARAQLRELIVASDGAAEMPITGGELAISYRNPLPDPVTISLSTNATGWTIEPVDHKLEIPAGQSADAKFTAKPASSNPARPTIVEEYTTADDHSFSRRRVIPLYASGKLAELTEFAADGNVDEWSAVPALAMDDSASVFHNAKSWKGASDSSCRIRAAMAGERLAVMVEVTDNQLLSVPDAKPWEQDGLEVCWDIRPKAQSGMTAGTGQISLAPSEQPGQPATVVWLIAGKEAPAAPASVQAFTRRVEGGYIAEISIPFADLGLEGGTLKDGVIRLSVTQNDLDRASDPVLKRLSLTGTGDFWRTTAGYARFAR